MKKITYLFMIAFMAFSFYSCQEELILDSTLDVEALKDLSNEGGSIELKFKASDDWVIDVADIKTSEWLSVDPASGEKGDIVAEITALENPNHEGREAIIRISMGDLFRDITVVQKQLDAVIGEDDTIDLTYVSGTFTVPIEHNVDYTVAIPEGSEWLSESTTKALEPTDVKFAYTENISPDPRTGIIEISGSGETFTYTIIQAPNPEAIINIPDANFKAYLTAVRLRIWEETAPTKTRSANSNEVENIRELIDDSEYSSVSNIATANTNYSSSRATKTGKWVFPGGKVDANGDGEISVAEAAKIEHFHVSGEEVSSLVGIEYMSNLRHIGCPGGQYTDEEWNVVSSGLITSIDLTKCPKLVYIHCDFNKITTLDGIANLTKLETLSCQWNQLIILDISKCTNLIELICDKNKIEVLDVANLTKLDDLWCQNNQIEVLDFSGIPNLIKIYCDGNKIETLDLSNLPNLETLYCQFNEFTTLDVSKLTNLTAFHFAYNQLTTIDISKNLALTKIGFNGNKFTTTLNTSSNTALTSLACTDNDLTSLDVSKNTALETLAFAGNELTSIGVSTNTLLTVLKSERNKLTTINVSNNPNLIGVWCNPMVDADGNNLLETIYLNSVHDTSNTRNWKIPEGTEQIVGSPPSAK